MPARRAFGHADARRRRPSRRPGGRRSGPADWHETETSGQPAAFGLPAAASGDGRRRETARSRVRRGSGPRRRPPPGPAGTRRLPAAAAGPGNRRPARTGCGRSARPTRVRHRSAPPMSRSVMHRATLIFAICRFRPHAADCPLTDCDGACTSPCNSPGRGLILVCDRTVKLQCQRAGARSGAMSELDQYDYDLPKELIAQSPAVCRTDARLLVVDRRRKSLEHTPHSRSARDPAPERLPGDQRHAGGARPAGGPASQHGRPLGRAVPGGKSRRPVAGAVQDPRKAPARRYDHAAQRRRRRGRAARTGGEGARRHLDRPAAAARKTPSRCWIGWAACRCRPTSARGEMVESDREHYQTVYAQVPGAVAAPTAGLHFTTTLLEAVGRARASSFAR